MVADSLQSTATYDLVLAFYNNGPYSLATGSYPYVLSWVVLGTDVAVSDSRTPFRCTVVNTITAVDATTGAVLGRTSYQVAPPKPGTGSIPACKAGAPTTLPPQQDCISADGTTRGGQP